MRASALDLIQEALRHSDPQVRSNAATALGVLATPESIRELLILALEDSDAGVRTRAEQEIARLAAHHQVVIVEQLEMLFDGKGSREAYALAGRLAATRSSQFAPPRGGWLRRLRLALSHYFLLWGGATAFERFSLIWRSLWGATNGFLAFTLFLIIATRRVPATRDVLPLYFLTLLLASVLTFAAAMRSTPIWLYPDRAAASLLETIAALVAGGFVGVAATAAMAAAASGSGGTPWVLLLMASAGAVVGTRIGTLAAGGTSRTEWIEARAREFAGAAFGILVVTAVIALVSQDYAGTGTILVEFAAATVGLSTAYAAADLRRSPPVAVTRFARIATMLVVIALSVSAIASGRRLRTAEEARIAALGALPIDIGSNPTGRDVLLTQSPQVFEIAPARPLVLQVTCSDCARSSYNVMLLRQDGALLQSSYLSSERNFYPELRDGEYYLVVSESDRESYNYMRAPLQVTLPDMARALVRGSFGTPFGEPRPLRVPVTIRIAAR
jgi:hypothetical protein